MPTNVKMHVEVEDQGLVHVHPETNLEQVLDMTTGKSLKEMIETNGLGGGGSKLNRTTYTITATVAGQKEFPFGTTTFDKTRDLVSVYVNGEFMHVNEEFTIQLTAGQLPKVVFVNGITVGDKVHVVVDTQSATSGNGSNSNLPVALDDYYVDANLGNDEVNDGTVNKPFKSITRAAKEVSDSGTQKSIIIHVKNGTYYDTTIGFCKAQLSITGESENGVILRNTDPSKSCLVSNRNNIVFPTNLTLKPIADTYAYSVTIYYTTRFQISQLNVTLDHSEINNGAKAGFGFACNDISTLYLKAKCKSVDTLISTSINSAVILTEITSDSGIVHANVGEGSTISFIEYNFDKKLVSVNNIQDSGLNYNLVNKGIIIESGSNVNGSYRLFGDGTIIITSRHIATDAVHDNSIQFLNVQIPHVLTSVETSLINVAGTAAGVMKVEARIPANKGGSDLTSAIIEYKSDGGNGPIDFDMFIIGRWK